MCSFAILSTYLTYLREDGGRTGDKEGMVPIGVLCGRNHWLDVILQYIQLIPMLYLTARNDRLRKHGYVPISITLPISTFPRYLS